MDLVILAAGLGSRFGGLKQLQPVDDKGNFIIDFSVYDALRCGFDRIIFIIKKENYNLFKFSIGNRIEKFIKVLYVFQEMPSNFCFRTKPLGTGHALLSAKGITSKQFAVINADDFYGFKSFFSISMFLKQNTKENIFSMVGFPLKKTISSNKEYKRGICSVYNNKLLYIDESVILKNNDTYEITSTKNGEKKLSYGNETTSVNMFGFSSLIFNLLEKDYVTFLKTNKNNLENCEFFLPNVVSNYINSKKIQVEVLNSDNAFFGITHKTDLEEVKRKISFLKKEKLYPNCLW